MHDYYFLTLCHFSLNIHDDAMKNIIITKQQQLGIDLLSVFESYVREAKDQMND